MSFPEHQETKPITVLAVDDEEQNRKIIKGHLKKLENTEIIEVDNGVDAVDIAQNNLPDLILLDIMMPGQDGFETCSQLKSQEETSNIPVIFLTALDDISSKKQGFQVGGVDYVSKPFQPEELVSRIRTHVTLQEKKQQLLTYSQDLEGLVQERTQELNKNYEILNILNQILELSLQDIELPDLMQNALSRILSLPWLQFQQQGCIYIYDPENQLLQVQAQYNLQEALEQVSYVDDFGTGYSSLSYLQKFPIDQIKIDRSFVWNMEPENNDHILVKAITNMAQNLKNQIVAEGIEKREQLELLQELGCEYGQGFYFSKPLPAQEAENLLRHQLNTSRDKIG